jgi:ABC-type lipoprotein release transport system permease subunit
MNYFKIAWRNIWRNKKRTLITAASVFFALFLAILMVGLQEGTYAHMIKISVEDFYGYAQVHGKGFSEDKTLTNSLEYNQEIVEYLNSNKNVKQIQPRIESFALSAFSDKSKGIVILGIDPNMEFEKPTIKKRLVAGNFEEIYNDGIVITEKLAEYLGAEIGDSLALIGQGYQGISAVGLYKIVATISMPNPMLNSGLAYLDIKTAQELFSLENRLTGLSLSFNDNRKFKETTQELRSNLPDGYEIFHWEEEMPEIKQFVESDRAGGQIFLVILYIIIGFGIFGTALMMIAERIKEFGIMVAVGMQKMKIVILVGVEMLYITSLGIIASIVFSIPVMYYLNINPITFTGDMAKTYESYGFEPIMPAAFQLDYFITQPIVVIIITILAIIYPLWGISKLNVIKSLRK